jgi:hypothetical protein
MNNPIRLAQFVVLILVISVILRQLSLPSGDDHEASLRATRFHRVMVSPQFLCKPLVLSLLVVFHCSWTNLKFLYCFGVLFQKRAISKQSIEVPTICILGNAETVGSAWQASSQWPGIRAFWSVRSQDSNTMNEELARLAWSEGTVFLNPHSS